MVVYFVQPCGALTVILLHALVRVSAAALEPYDVLYSSGVEALQRGDYTGVVHYMEKALENFTQVRKSKIRCGLKCRDQHKLDATATQTETATATTTELQMFDAILRRAACLNDCLGRKLGPPSLHKVHADIDQDFNRRIPYNYLQLAYNKVKSSDAESSLYSDDWDLTPVCCVQEQGYVTGLSSLADASFIKHGHRYPAGQVTSMNFRTWIKK